MKIGQYTRQKLSSIIIARFTNHTMRNRNKTCFEILSVSWSHPTWISFEISLMVLAVRKMESSDHENIVVSYTSNFVI